MGNVIQVTNMMDPSNNSLKDNIDDENLKDDEYMSKSSNNIIYTASNNLETDQEKLEYWMEFTNSW